jgi:hypothetical protein
MIKIKDEDGDDMMSPYILKISKKDLTVSREKKFNDSIGVPLDAEGKVQWKE